MNAPGPYGLSQYNTLPGVKPLAASNIDVTINHMVINKDDLLGQNEPENGRYRNKPTGRLGPGDHRLSGYDGVPDWDKQTPREYEKSRRLEKETEMKKEIAKNLRKEVEEELELAADEKATASKELKRDKALIQSQLRKDESLKKEQLQKDSMQKITAASDENSVQGSTGKRASEQLDSSLATKRQKPTSLGEAGRNRSGQNAMNDAPSTPVMAANPRMKPVRAQHTSPPSSSKNSAVRKRRCILHTKSHKTCPDDCPNPRE